MNEMSLGAGRSEPIRSMLGFAALALSTLAGCSAFDSGLLDRLIPKAPGDDAGLHEPSPDAGATMDGGMPMDGGTPMDSSAPEDSGSHDDAASDASGDASGADAEDDAGPECGVEGVDCCPDDPSKLAPGVCGCGMPDDDGDADGSADCIDQCPSDATKSEPGACGCGTAETAAADCSALHAALVHRYRFEGTGTVATDSVSGADGTVWNAALDGSSTLTLAGGTSNEYVELPAGIVSTLTDATFEAWIVWQGAAIWERVFDFGNSSGSNGSSYVFVTPKRGGGNGSLRGTLSLSGNATEIVADAPATLSSGTLHHVALVVDDLVEIRLYLDGVLQATTANTTRSLSSLSDQHNWLGRSNYSADSEFGGTYHEFRIYDAALSDAQVATSFALGPDPAFLE